MEYQVRVMKVLPGRMDDFIVEWTAHIARIRRRRGFTIVGAWVVDDTDEFVWIMGYDGEDGFATADRDYYESEERRTVEPDPARLVESTNDHMGRRVV